MRRFSLLLSIVAVVLLGIMARMAQPIAVAQEATPPADMAIEGTTFEPVSFALGIELASPSDVFLFRIGLAPGTGFPIEASDPAAGFLLVESGTFTVQMDGPVRVTRGETLGEAMGAAESTGDLSAAAEAIADGDAVTLEAGDAAYIPGNITSEIRNDGEERAVGLAFTVGPSEGMMAEATPVP